MFDALLALVADPSKCDCWEMLAWKWWAVLIVAATVVAAAMLLVKFILKNTGPLSGQAWSAGKAYLFIFLGLFPVLGFTCLWFLLDEERFREVIQPTGLMSGTVISWGMYLTLMLLAHLGRWRRDLLFRRQ